MISKYQKPNYLKLLLLFYLLIYLANEYDTKKFVILECFR